MDQGEPIIDFQDGAMATANRAVDHCTVIVVEDSTFDELTFRNVYKHDRQTMVDGVQQQIGTIASDTVTNSVTFLAQSVIEGVKTYQLATGAIMVKHYKN